MGNIWDVRVVLFSLKLSAAALEQTRSPYLPKNVKATLYKKEKFLALIQLGIFFLFVIVGKSSVPKRSLCMKNSNHITKEEGDKIIIPYIHRPVSHMCLLPAISAIVFILVCSNVQPTIISIRKNHQPKKHQSQLRVPNDSSGVQRTNFTCILSIFCV